MTIKKISYLLIVITLFQSCVDFSDDKKTVSKKKKVKKEFYNNGELKSEYYYSDNELTHYNIYDSTGNLIDFDRSVGFEIIECNDTLIQAEIKFLGEYHPNRDTMIIRVSEPFKYYSEFQNTRKGLLMPDSNGIYIYQSSFNRSGDHKILVSAREFNYALTRSKDPRGAEYMLTIKNKFFNVKPNSFESFLITNSDTTISSN